jgi:hypothetical protein
VLGAAGFVTGVFVFTPQPNEVLVLGAWCVALGNAVGGSVQRYLAAARRIATAGSASLTSDIEPSASAREAGREMILGRSLAVAPFVLLPIASPIADFVADSRVPALVLLATCFAAALPPILFDAKRAARRFRLTAYSLAAILGAAAWSLDGPGVRPLLGTALVLAAYPALNALLARGALRGLIAVLIVAVLAKAAMLAHDPMSPLPLAEGLLALLAMAAVLEHKPAG